MTNQGDILMELEIEGRTRTVFGILDPQRFEEKNGHLIYHGDIRPLNSVYKVPEYVPGDRFNRCDLVRALEKARTHHIGISGIIATEESSYRYWCESHEGWNSHWQPYIIT